MATRCTAGGWLGVGRRLLLTVLAVVFLYLAHLQPSFAQVRFGDVRLLRVTALTATTSACVNQWPAVLNCTFPASLISSIDGFPANTGTRNFTGSASQSLYLYLVGADGAVLASSQLTLKATDNATSTASGPIRLSTYAPSLFGEALGARLYDSVSGNWGNTTWGLASLRAYPVPTLLSISGCQGNGSSTLLCVPDSSVLTIQGSGFVVLRELSSFTLFIGGQSTNLYSSKYQLVNDTLTLNLGDVYSFLNVDYEGSPQLLSILCDPVRSSGHPGFSTNALSISFAPLPSPIVRISASAGGCVGRTGNITQYSGCLPGVSTLTLAGHYLSSSTYALTAAGLGSFLCTLNYASGTAAQIVVPLILQDVPGQLWDLVATNSGGSTSLPSAVQFTTAPSAAFVATCSRVGLGSYLPNCLPGTTVTISGSNFLPDVQVILTDDLRKLSTTCLTPRVVDKNTVICVLPVFQNATEARLMYGRNVRLSLFFPSTTQTTNTLLVYILFAYPDSPILRSITGCEASTGPLSLSRCRSGDVVTVQGANLIGGRNSGVTLVSQSRVVSGSCALLPESSNTTVLCRVPDLDDSSYVQDGDVVYIYYELSFYDGQLSWNKYGNLSSFTFTLDPVAVPAPPSDPSDDSSSVNVAAIVAPVVIVFVLVAVLGGWLLRRRVMETMTGEDRASSAWTSMPSDKEGVELR